MASKHFLRYLVGLLYGIYAAVIVTAVVFDKLPVRWTVLTCLCIHFAGLIIGFIWKGLHYVYPEECGEIVRLIIMLWDIVQFIFLLILCFSDNTELYDACAYIALIGVLLCFVKVYKVTQ